MYQLGLSVSSMLGRLFSRGVDSALTHEINGWSPGCPVPCFMQIKSKLIANKTPPGTWCMLEALIVSSKPWIDVCWSRGSKLYPSAWEPLIMCLAWKILKILYRGVDKKGMPLKIAFIYDLSFELQHLCKSLLPSAKGLSIYFYIILLLLLSHHLLN